MSDDSPEISEELLHDYIRTQERGEGLIPVAESEIGRMANGLQLQDGTITVAKAIYRRSLKTRLINSYSLVEITSGALYAACRIEGEPIGIEEIVQVSKAPYRQISQVYSHLSKQLNLKVGPANPKDFVPDICHRLGLSKQVENTANQLLDQTMEKEAHVGKSPSGLAASAVYVAALIQNEPKTQLEVSDASIVSPKTISQRHRDLVEAAELLSDN